MLEVTAEGWAVTLVVIFGLLVLDWVVLGRRSRTISLSGAARWSLFYVAVSLAFGLIFGVLNGSGLATQYLTGYLVELSLSVDNLFVFVIIIGSFAVPDAQQPKALTIGITLALVLRAVFIALGAALLQLFSFMFLIFGVALMITAIQLFRHRDQDPQVEDSPIVAWARRALPMSSGYDEGRIVTRRSGRRVLTPLFLALLAIGTSDLLFAFDSIPAVFGITNHAYIVFTVNAFALLGLRPLYFLVSGLLSRLVYLSTGLALILGFIGVKLILEFAHERNHAISTVPTAVSLAVIVAVLVATTIASVFKSKRDPASRAHAGALRGGDSRDEAPTATRDDAPGAHDVRPSE